MKISLQIIFLLAAIQAAVSTSGSGYGDHKVEESGEKDKKKGGEKKGGENSEKSGGKKNGAGGEKKGGEKSKKTKGGKKGSSSTEEDALVGAWFAKYKYYHLESHKFLPSEYYQVFKPTKDPKIFKWAECVSMDNFKSTFTYFGTAVLVGENTYRINPDLQIGRDHVTDGFGIVVNTSNEDGLESSFFSLFDGNAFTSLSTPTHKKLGPDACPIY
mmetsp:Transcript_21846/g.35164  ORF Transcript_21846/g.35164 Transcript_21846/m.35164 type:complete len:215 (+) Transcript_21846:36-680(+)